jgi:hypothetical protein
VRVGLLAIAAVITYVVPGEGNYVRPTSSLDRNWRHLEGRLNYEALNTASLWVGYNLPGRLDGRVTLTTKVGGAFGDVARVVPGYAGTIALVETRFLHRGRVSLRPQEIVRQLSLQLVGARGGAGALAACRARH